MNIPLLAGSIFMLTGILMLIFPPVKINSLYGYRTSSSMKSQERWNFAQKYSAKQMIKLGGLLTLTSTINLIYKPTESIAIITGLALTIALVVIVFVRVEKAIKNRFSE